MKDKRKKEKHNTFFIKWRKSDKLVSSIDNWKVCADQFYRASEYLFTDITKDDEMRTRGYERRQTDSAYPLYVPFLHPVYNLQIGYCLENMLKGIIIFEHPELIEGGEMSKKITNHNLDEYAKKINIDFTEVEMEFLGYLKECIKWVSKYPMPLYAEDTVNFENYDPPNTRRLFRDIYKKLSEYMEETCKLRPDYHNYEPME